MRTTQQRACGKETSPYSVRVKEMKRPRPTARQHALLQTTLRQHGNTTRPKPRRRKRTTRAVFRGTLFSFTTRPQSTTAHDTQPNTQHDNPNSTHRLSCNNSETITITMVQKRGNDTLSQQQEMAKRATEEPYSCTRDGLSTSKKYSMVDRDSKESPSSRRGSDCESPHKQDDQFKFTHDQQRRDDTKSQTSPALSVGSKTRFRSKPDATQSFKLTRKTMVATGKYDRQRIADVFAEFNEDHCTSTTRTHEHEHEDQYEQHQDTMKPFAMQEIERGQRRDDQILHQNTQQAFTTIVKQSHQQSGATTTELERHDDQSGAQERGPGLAIEPPSCTNCSSNIFKRVQPTLDDNQTDDQSGFRPVFSTTDHFFTRSSNSDREPPSGTSPCVAAIGFKKVFGTVEHSSVWAVFREQGVQEHHTYYSQKLDHQQRAAVHTDVKGNYFHLEQGTMLGEPISMLLFNGTLDPFRPP